MNDVSTLATARKTAALYIRVSTAKQAAKDKDPDGYSVPAQKEAGYRKAETLDADVVDIKVDRGESAKTVDRPEFQRLLHRIRTQRDIDYLIVDKLDRFARNRRDDANLLFELRTAGCQLVSVKENIDASPAGQLLHAIMAGIAEFYSANLGTEALKGMTQKAKVGGTPGRAPIGYLNTRERIDGREVRTVAIDPDRASHIQWAFEAYATGQHTIRSITEALDDRGVRALPRGKKVPGPLQLSHVHHMLRNRYYLGYVTFQGAEYQGRHEPLVSPALFSRVQDLLHAHDRAGEKQRIHNHYLKGSIFCGRCLSRLCYTKAKDSYGYFYCLGRQQRRTTCQLPYLPVEAVEDAIVIHYRTERITEQQQDRARTGLKTELDDEYRRSEPELAWATKRVGELDAERRRLARGVIDGSIPGDLAREEHDRIARDLGQAQAILATARTTYADIEDTLNIALGILGRVDEANASLTNSASTSKTVPP